jgi:hypothetical protein
MSKKSSHVHKRGPREKARLWKPLDVLFLDENEVDEIHEFVLHPIFCDDEGQSGVDGQSTNREGCSTSTLGTTKSKSNELIVCEERDRLIVAFVDGHTSDHDRLFVGKIDDDRLVQHDRSK